MIAAIQRVGTCLSATAGAGHSESTTDVFGPFFETAPRWEIFWCSRSVFSESYEALPRLQVIEPIASCSMGSFVLSLRFLPILFLGKHKETRKLRLSLRVYSPGI